jgi:hypothetical protein
MSQFGRYSLRLSLALAFSVAASLAYAVNWSDDFNDGSVTDGNPVTWSQNAAGAFPGTYDASSGDYVLSQPTGPFEQLVTWVDNVNFTDVYVRAQGVILPGPAGEDSGNLALLARLNDMFVTGYILYLGADGTLGLQVALGNDIQDITEVELGDLNAASDVIMELNIVGTQLSGYVWRPGDSKPATPQITGESGIFESGEAGIAYDQVDDNTIGVFRWAMAQDTPFVDVTPGDFNGDGRVDAADYVAWREGFTNGTFDNDDYTTWRRNFGAGAGSGSGSLAAAAAPEPATLGLVFLLLAGVAVTRVR